ncbi:NINE protein [Kordiimonas sp. SCSIO 12610]|uniref:NINE protein n=1 Tax=Kordiimonas sp. SCSIO 12610 TaxID=2829597 RepID=UPI00210D2977|nr:NINE protein [Kordiimonas sp. SCSIO 12610]UTW53881.1 NINE protein [Kordiimonas sp. SCSIO 12610]
METIYAIIDWLKEYGDVLGGMGSIFAITTLMLTNSKVIINRVRGVSDEDQITDTSDTQSNVLTKFVKPNIKTIAILPIETIGSIDQDFIDGLTEELHVEIQQMGLTIVPVNNARNSLNISLRKSDDIMRATIHVRDMNKASIFSERYTVKLTDMISSQTDIAVSISNDITKHILAKKGEKQREKVTVISTKSRALTTVLAIFLGVLGIHRYYIGRPFTGILYTITGGLFVIGWFMDIILASTGLLADGKGRPISGKRKRLRMEERLNELPTNVDRE